jgi:formylglycine-generating enzyme required for sulfatase activity
MRQVTLAAVVGAGLVCAAHAGLGRSDLSGAALKLLPEKDMIRVTTTTGKVMEGTFDRETEKVLVLRMGTGRIGYAKPIDKTTIASRDVLPLDDFFIEALLPFELNNSTSFELAFYDEKIALFDEFVALCRLHAKVSTIRERREAFKEERKKVAVGMEKIEGEWYAPIAAAVKNFDRISNLMARLVKRFPGVGSDGFRGPVKAQKQYDAWSDERRAIARGLPKIVTERIPLAIKTRNYDEAAEEVTAFLNFYIFRVVEAEEGSRVSLRGGNVAQQMDFGYITRLERQIVEAYAKDTPAPKPPAGANEPNMVFVPGGYFLMGDEASKPGSDTFPMRIIKLDPYLIDKHEVTNKAYREFVDYAKSTGDSSMEHPDAPPLKDHTPAGWSQASFAGDDQPVVGVDWFDAYAYAKWKGKRLPTEAEWEMAARSRDGRVWPWDKDPVAPTFVNTPKGRILLAEEIDLENPKPRRKQTMMEKVKGIEPPPPPKTRLPTKTWPADSPIPPQADMDDFADMITPTSPYGLMHLPGNAAEWVNDYYSPRAYYDAPLRNPAGPEDGRDHVFRGGNFTSLKQDELQTFVRAKGVGRPKSRSRLPYVGFRCAKSLP